MQPWIHNILYYFEYIDAVGWIVNVITIDAFALCTCEMNIVLSAAIKQHLRKKKNSAGVCILFWNFSCSLQYPKVLFEAAGRSFQGVNKKKIR